jgi:ribosome maturation factor RimP
MIETNKIEKLVNDILTPEYFLVDITVKPGNVIEVTVDGDHGITILKCVEISRHIEQNLDREDNDFELSVFSSGLGNPLKVLRQYYKNIGKEVEVALLGEKLIKGIIKSVDNEGFEIEVRSLVKELGNKKKVEVIESKKIRFDSKPEVRNIISFK